MIHRFPVRLNPFGCLVQELSDIPVHDTMVEQERPQNFIP